MKVLVDSHIAVWWLDDPSRLSQRAREVIADPANEVFLSAATVWELGLKIAKGKLLMPVDFTDVLREDGFSDLPITVDHANASIHLPRHHGDPFDRLLIAQAIVDDLVLITRDAAMFEYELALLKG
ncbi:MAG: type II toxin-antitoxin system VapC family toxin [Verrucomicrobiae bacterium]|nr:type II toxin-antitoxin system VapC family toxin [Verrucomicrobiae bacterium]